MKQFCLCFVAVLCFMPYVLSQPLTCKDSSYRKIYGSGSDTVKGYHHIALSNNRTVITGKYKATGAAVSEGWMMLIKEDGTPVKSSRTASPDVAKSFAWVQGIALQNNASVLMGVLYDKVTHDGHELVVTKRDGNLNPVWTRRYRLNPAVLGSLNELFITNHFLWEAGNGDVILLLNGLYPGGLMSNYHMVARINGADGSLVWHKTFIPVHQESLGYASGAFQSGNSLVITGYMDMPPITTGDVPAVYAMRLNWADGSLQLLKRYRYNTNDFGAWDNSFEQYKGRRIAGGGYEIYGEEYQQGHTEDREYMAVQLNENLELTGSQSWSIDYTFADNEASVADAAGNFVVLNRGGSGSAATHLSVYNRNGKHRRRRLNTTQNNADWGNEQNGARIAFKPNGNTTVLLNYYNAGRPVTELMQLVPEDTLDGCTGTEVSAGMEPISFKLEADPTGWKTVLDNGLEELTVTLTDVALPVTEDAVCKVVVPVVAGALSLGSDAVVCNNDTLVLTATGGLNSYTWPVNYHLLPVNDSTVKVAPDKDTAYIVQAVSKRGCALSDTVAVTVKICTSTPGNSCSDSSFRKMYDAGPDAVIGHHHHHLLSGNQTLVTGTYTPAGTTVSAGWMLLLADGGAVVKSNKTPWIEAGKSLRWSHGVALKNGGSAVLGTVYESVAKGVFDLVISKRDNNLNAVWNRRYVLNTAVAGNPFDAPLVNELIAEADNGDLLVLVSCSGYFSAIGANGHIVARISGADGSIVWSKTFTSDGVMGVGYASGIFQQNNSVVVTGYQESPTLTMEEVTAVYAMKLSMADGSMQLLKRYRFNNNYFGGWSNNYNQYKARRISGGYEIYGEVYEDATDRGAMAVQLDENLELTGSRGWQTDYEVGDVLKSGMDTAGNMLMINRGRAGNQQTHVAFYSRHGRSRNKLVNIPANIGDWVDNQSGIRIGFKANGNTTLLMNYAHNGVPVTELLQVVPEDTLTSCSGSEAATVGMASVFQVKPDATPWRSVLDNVLLMSNVSLTDEVQAVTENGICKTVIAMDDAALSLGNDTAVCNMDTVVLKATTGLNNYTWPVAYRLHAIDANTVKVYPDKDTAYIVQAATAHGCTVTDTVQVQVWDTPQDFLPADTVICAGSSVVLQSTGTFNTYEWSTGATATSVTVNNAGSYLLKVTDANGCRGEDNITVALKSCSTYVYIPTGFTPDNNGVNDVFRPTVSGNLASYYFAVYNRWGQCVFTSRQPGNGWNGTFKNARQGTGTYTWMCKYRFEGGSETIEKGTVVLIR